MPIPFHPLTFNDKELVQQRVRDTDCRNCDLNFTNLISWRFMYDTEVADLDGWLLFRFKADGHNAYLAPVGRGPWNDVMQALLADAESLGHPFLMLGVCEDSLAQLEEAMPGHFYATSDRAYTDYIYLREKLATFAGKKLQSKRNFANRFISAHPDWEVLPLSRDLIPECIRLDEQWARQKTAEASAGRYTYDAERQSLLTAFNLWEHLGTHGIALRTEGRIVAFSYGAQVNADTFDVSMEKADTNFEGAFQMICREMARSLPESFTFINREEDLGIEGLRRSKLSYCPHLMLKKYTVMTKHPFGNP